MKKWQIIKTVLYFLLAVLVGVFFNVLLDNVRYVVGPLMIVYGLESIVVHLALKKKFSEENECFRGVFEVMLGVLLLLSKEISYESACIIWAIWSIFRETRELEEIFKRIEHKIPVIVDLAESVFSIIISILLILNPEEYHIAIHAVFLIVELISTVSLPYFRSYYIKRNGKLKPDELKAELNSSAEEKEERRDSGADL